MRLRPPSVPLITVDPYFSLWSPADHLTDCVTTHWTGSPQTMVGYAAIDGESYRFLGKLHPGDTSPAMEEISRDCDALHTVYVFAAAGVELTATFMTPLLLDDLDVMSRPVSYLRLSVRSTDRACHMVGIRLAVSDLYGGRAVFCEDRQCPAACSCAFRGRHPHRLGIFLYDRRGCRLRGREDRHSLFRRRCSGRLRSRNHVCYPVARSRYDGGYRCACYLCIRRRVFDPLFRGKAPCVVEPERYDHPGSHRRRTPGVCDA